MNITGSINHYETTTSTQHEAKFHLDGVHWTSDQTAGKGRFDRVWHSEKDKSVAVSIALPAYKNHPKPFLVGMSIAVAIADKFRLQIQWPNDLVLGKKKVGGILTEIVHGIPVVGIGLNLGAMSFPTEIDTKATSLVNEGHEELAPAQALQLMVDAIKAFEPMPNSWTELKARWMKFDTTEGKVFQTQDETIGIAIGISDEGELLWNSRGEFRILSVAEALWGSEPAQKEA